MVVGRLVLEPGWRWSEHVRPIAGTTSCQFHHVGLALSGAMDGRMDDGTEFEVRPGDVFDVPPGHDNWVIGDEPMTAVIWGGWRGWGKPPVGERILTTMLITDIAGSTDRAAAVGDAVWDQLLDRHHAPRVSCLPTQASATWIAGFTTSKASLLRGGFFCSPQLTTTMRARYAPETARIQAEHLVFEEP